MKEPYWPSSDPPPRDVGLHVDPIAGELVHMLNHLSTELELKVSREFTGKPPPPPEARGVDYRGPKNGAIRPPPSRGIHRLLRHK